MNFTSSGLSVIPRTGSVTASAFIAVITGECAAPFASFGIRIAALASGGIVSIASCCRAGFGLWLCYGTWRPCQPHPAFRIEQEVSGHDDPVAFRNSAGYSNPVTICAGNLYRTRLKHALARLDINDLAQSAVQNCFGRNGQTGRHFGFELDIDEHIGAQQEQWIVRLTPQLECARSLIEEGSARANSGLDGLSQFRDSYFGARAGARFAFIPMDIGDDPDFAQVRNAVEFCPFLKSLPRGDAARENNAISRRFQIDYTGLAVRFAQLFDLLIAHSEQTELLFVEARRFLDLPHVALTHACLKTLDAGYKSKIGGLGSPEFRTIQLGKLLAFLHQSSGRIVSERLDPPVGSRQDPIQLILVGHYSTSGAHHPQSGTPGRRSDSNADQLLSFRTERDRSWRPIGPRRTALRFIDRFQSHAAVRGN